MRRSRTVTVQDKAREIAFFDQHAEADEYNVFAPETTADIVDRFIGFAGLRPGDLLFTEGGGHVQLVISKNAAISAPQTGERVRYVPLARLRGQFAGARRLLN